MGKNAEVSAAPKGAVNRAISAAASAGSSSALNCAVTRTLTYAFSRETSSAVSRGPNSWFSAEVRAEVNAAIPMRVPGTAAGGKTAVCSSRVGRGGCRCFGECGRAAPVLDSGCRSVTYMGHRPPGGFSGLSACGLWL